MYDAAMAKLGGRQRAWGEAVAQARQEYSAKGIENPDDTTPGFLESINEIYHAKGKGYSDVLRQCIY